MTYSEFKQLPKPEHDLFISKFLHAVHSDLACYQYATLPMHVNIKELSFQNFLALPKLEHAELITVMLNNVNQNEKDFEYADWIVLAAEVTGMYKDVKFGAELFNNDAEKDLYATELIS